MVYLTDDRILLLFIILVMNSNLENKQKTYFDPEKNVSQQSQEHQITYLDPIRRQTYCPRQNDPQNPNHFVQNFHLQTANLMPHPYFPNPSQFELLNPQEAVSSQSYQNIDPTLMKFNQSYPNVVDQYSYQSASQTYKDLRLFNPQQLAIPFAHQNQFFFYDSGMNQLPTQPMHQEYFSSAPSNVCLYYPMFNSSGLPDQFCNHGLTDNRQFQTPSNLLLPQFYAPTYDQIKTPNPHSRFFPEIQQNLIVGNHINVPHMQKNVSISQQQNPQLFTDKNVFFSQQITPKMLIPPTETHCADQNSLDITQKTANLVPFHNNMPLYFPLGLFNSVQKTFSPVVEKSHTINAPLSTQLQQSSQNPQYLYQPKNQDLPETSHLQQSQIRNIEFCDRNDSKTFLDSFFTSKKEERTDNLAFSESLKRAVFDSSSYFIQKIECKNHISYPNIRQLLELKTIELRKYKDYQYNFFLCLKGSRCYFANEEQRKETANLIDQFIKNNEKKYSREIYYERNTQIKERTTIQMILRHNLCIIKPKIDILPKNYLEVLEYMQKKDHRWSSTKKSERFFVHPPFRNAEGILYHQPTKFRNFVLYCRLSKISDVIAIDKSVRLLSPNVYWGNGALIGENCYICDNVYIGNNVTILDETSILSNSYLSDGLYVGSKCRIGCNTFIGSNTILIGNNNIGEWLFKDKRTSKFPEIYPDMKVYIDSLKECIFDTIIHEQNLLDFGCVVNPMTVIMRGNVFQPFFSVSGWSFIDSGNTFNYKTKNLRSYCLVINTNGLKLYYTFIKHGKLVRSIEEETKNNEFITYVRDLDYLDRNKLNEIIIVTADLFKKIDEFPKKLL
ncbi:hypothetical protein EDEG_03053 [Edhazardia aedis USNM 41457]|uniref:Mannose-1-phosphate guanylyltransferase n=1 Tax=Edhazardia aedis (strain USNM 41457) TaxID=1003232 RepID=J9D429_EDHAE|nr:hypothetical protein EDEG_03053 [Edhazardia aedis USNM 41457]|eukprot:EJW02541.1 hypothetical protein EDEG_03053 [Edhazardia aedis USNM 41457]